MYGVMYVNIYVIMTTCVMNDTYSSTWGSSAGLFVVPDVLRLLAVSSFVGGLPDVPDLLGGVFRSPVGTCGTRKIGNT
jgi:hypothetical protein